MKGTEKVSYMIKLLTSVGLQKPVYNLEDFGCPRMKDLVNNAELPLDESRIRHVSATNNVIALRHWMVFKFPREV